MRSLFPRNSDRRAYAAIFGMFLASASISALVAACTPPQTVALVANSVAEAEILLTAAENTATVYVQLPNCPAPKGGLCSDAATRDKIKAADNVAYSAVKAARANAGTVAAAVSAIAGLIVATPPAAK